MRGTFFRLFAFVPFFIFALTMSVGCRSTRKAQTVVVDSVETAATVVNATSTAADSIAHSIAAAVESQVVETATSVVELYDSTGRVTQRTTTTTHRQTVTAANRTEQTIATHTTADTLLMRDTLNRKTLIISTTENEKSAPAPRARFYCLILLFAAIVLLIYRLLNAASHD